MAAPPGFNTTKWDQVVTDMMAITGRNRNFVDNWMNQLWSGRRYPDRTAVRDQIQQYVYDRCEALGLPQPGTHFTALVLLCT